MVGFETKANNNIVVAGKSTHKDEVIRE